MCIELGEARPVGKNVVTGAITQHDRFLDDEDRRRFFGTPDHIIACTEEPYGAG
jgi:hypothetical protein